jgi:hypothetical protein
MVRVGEAGVIRGVLALPQIGVWHADFDLDTSEVPAGAVEIVAGEDVTFKGTVTSGGLYRGNARVRIGGGADGLRTTAKPRAYVRPTVRTVLSDLAAAAGEVISDTVAPGILARSLPYWTVLGLSVGQQVAALVQLGAPAGTSWRFLPDGTLWLGVETWAESRVMDYRELDRSTKDARLELGLDAPVLLPGTRLGEDRIGYVEHHVEEGRVWACVGLAT